MIEFLESRPDRVKNLEDVVEALEARKIDFYRSLAPVDGVSLPPFSALLQVPPAQLPRLTCRCHTILAPLATASRKPQTKHNSSRPLLTSCPYRSALPFQTRLAFNMATTAAPSEKTARERKPSTSAPITDFQGPIGPAGISRPKHKRTVTGFGAQEIKSIEASIPEGLRAA